MVTCSVAHHGLRYVTLRASASTLVLIYQQRFPHNIMADKEPHIRKEVAIVGL